MLSIQDLIEKAYVPQEKEILINIERMGGEIKVRIPFFTELRELREKHKENYEAMTQEFVYLNVIEPKLNDNKLIEAFKCQDKPYEIVDKIFGRETVGKIADLLISIREKDSNINEVKKIAKNIKN